MSSARDEHGQFWQTLRSLVVEKLHIIAERDQVIARLGRTITEREANIAKFIAEIARLRRVRIPLMSATDSDPCRPSIPEHAGRGGEAVWVLSR